MPHLLCRGKLHFQHIVIVVLPPAARSRLSRMDGRTGVGIHSLCLGSVGGHSTEIN